MVFLVAVFCLKSAEEDKYILTSQLRLAIDSSAESAILWDILQYFKFLISNICKYLSLFISKFKNKNFIYYLSTLDCSILKEFAKIWIILIRLSYGFIKLFITKVILLIKSIISNSKQKLVTKIFGRLLKLLLRCSTKKS